jgi:aldose 1-epimerase
VGGPAPSGRQFEIAWGDQEAVFTEVGATLRSYRQGDRPLVSGFGDQELCQGSRGQVLFPWPNRLDRGRFRFGSVEGRAAWDEPERACAIHGLVRWLAWEPVGQGPDWVRLATVLHPQPAYPFRVEAALEARLGPGGLSVSLIARNPGDGPLPMAAGFHPYLVAGPGTVDSWRLRLPAAARLEADERGLPRREVEVEGPYDFRQGAPIGPLRLDDCFCRLDRTDGAARGLDGPVAEVVLEDPAGGGCVLWADRAFGYLMVFTGDTLEPGRRRQAVAVEPMTSPPNALATGRDLVVLQPGQTFWGTWGIASA